MTVVKAQARLPTAGSGAVASSPPAMTSSSRGPRGRSDEADQRRIWVGAGPESLHPCVRPVCPLTTDVIPTAANEAPHILYGLPMNDVGRRMSFSSQLNPLNRSGSGASSNPMTEPPLPRFSGDIHLWIERPAWEESTPFGKHGPWT